MVLTIYIHIFYVVKILSGTDIVGFVIGLYIVWFWHHTDDVIDIVLFLTYSTFIIIIL